ncbi:MAG: type I-E CRISPR-associated protein Cas6/Cse3/CasE [Betaproteobacteria bacterium]|nr:type I-E CRISPR-associated protein Cas6/Cse3/CasE [Betaproteobacteria bacterium]
MSDRPAVLIKVPVAERAGVVSCHQKVYDLVGRQDRPLWRKCPGYLLVLARSAPGGFESKPYDPQPVIGQESTFDLLAEISVSKQLTKEGRGRRVDPILDARKRDPARSYDELASEIGGEWLKRRSVRLGFELISLVRHDYEVIEFVRQRQMVRIGAIRYAGTLRVSNSEQFKHTMLYGIGHSKAWGLGLLLCFKTKRDFGI